MAAEPAAPVPTTASGRARRQLTDGWAVALALAAAAGAWHGGGPSHWLAAAPVLLAGVARRPALLCIAVALWAAGLADAAHAGLVPVTAGEYRGWVTLVTDPDEIARSTASVTVRLDDGRRVDALAHGGVAGALGPALAGERLAVTGRLRPPPSDEPWLLARRVVGRLEVESIDATAPGPAVVRFANGYRHLLDRGTRGLAPTSRALLLGVVLGDDRDLPPEVLDDFRGSGLSHLTAVSGSNVAFALAVFGPFLRRLRWAARAPATITVLAWFALLTRFEPSVLRASCMAGLATVAAAVGRPQTGVRILALAVTALVLVDPLLVHAVGFGLSVGASAGIILLSAPLAERLPGPRFLAEALAVTLAAQAGALPVSILTFGSVPLATVPANLLAVPAAGPLMGWGMTAGIAAGMVGSPWRGLLQLPTRALTGWLAGVAGRSAGLPLGEIGVVAGAVFVLGAVVLALDRRRRRAHVAGAFAAVLVVAAALAGRPPPLGPGDGPVALGSGVEAWRTPATAGGPEAVVLGAGPDVRLADALQVVRRHGLRCPAAVVVESRGAPPADLASALARRCPGLVVVAASGAARPGWTEVPDGSALELAGLVLAADGAGGLQVGSPADGRARADARARPPPP